MYTEAAGHKKKIPIYAALPQDPSTVITVARMEDLTLEAQRSRNRAIGIAPYVPTPSAAAADGDGEHDYAEPRPDPLRGRGLGREPPDQHAAPRSLLGRRADVAAAAAAVVAAGAVAVGPGPEYLQPRVLPGRGGREDVEYTEPAMEGHLPPRFALPASGVERDRYALPKPLVRDGLEDDADAPRPGDVYAVPKRKSNEGNLPSSTSSSRSGPAPGLPPRSSEIPQAPPRLSVQSVDSVTLGGIGSYAQFLNQTYHRVIGVLLAER